MDKENNKIKQDAIFESVYEIKGSVESLRKELKNYFNLLGVALVLIIGLLVIIAK